MTTKAMQAMMMRRRKRRLKTNLSCQHYMGTWTMKRRTMMMTTSKHR
jgi:hypothetical protein